jgi:carbamoyl-phosphate synthase large subunit
MVKKDLKEALKFYDSFNVVDFNANPLKPILKNHVAVKEAVFPFNKLPGSDLILGPEMKSTGEVMGISSDFGISFAKSQFAAKNIIPTSGTVFISLTQNDKPYAKEIGQLFVELGFKIVATRGTHEALKNAGVKSELVLKLSEGRPNIDDSIKNGEIAIVINTSDNTASKSDAKKIRQSVLANSVAYFTTIAAAKAAARAIKALKETDALEPQALQDYLN